MVGFVADQDVVDGYEKLPCNADYDTVASTSRRDYRTIRESNEKR